MENLGLKFDKYLDPPDYPESEMVEVEKWAVYYADDEKPDEIFNTKAEAQKYADDSDWHNYYRIEPIMIEEEIEYNGEDYLED